MRARLAPPHSQTKSGSPVGATLTISQARAAELRVSYAGLAGLVQKVVADARIHLPHTLTGFTRLLTSPFYVAPGGRES